MAKIVLFCWTSFTRQLGDKEWNGGWCLTQTSSLTGNHNVANLCNLDGNQIWIESGPCPLVYFQELSHLATEEVSIFRLMGPTDCLSSLVVSQINSGSKVFVFFVQKRNWIYMCASVFVTISVCLSKYLCWGWCCWGCIFSLESCSFYVFVESDARAPKCNNS